MKGASAENGLRRENKAAAAVCLSICTCAARNKVHTTNGDGQRRTKGDFLGRSDSCRVVVFAFSPISAPPPSRSPSSSPFPTLTHSLTRAEQLLRFLVRTLIFETVFI